MLRKLRRSVARHRMVEEQDLKLFGKYAPKTAKVWDKRKKKFVLRDDVQKAYFARSWKAYC